MNWIVTPLRRTLDFSGRSTRMEYWMFTLAWLIVLIVIIAVDNNTSKTGALTGIFILLTALPILSLTIRRLHDAGRSGWWSILCYVWIIFAVLGLEKLIPFGFAGYFMVFAYALLDSEPRANEYGPNPKGKNKAINDGNPFKSESTGASSTKYETIPSQEKTFCTQCGSEHPGDTNFCTKCGAPITR